MLRKRLAIDIGGTFVDFVLLDEMTGTLKIDKEPSLHKSLTDCIFAGIKRLQVDLPDLDMIIHASTLVINTVLQERGSSVGLITTQGFRDVLELGRGNRPEVYNLLYKPPKPLVPRYLRFEVPERVNYKGDVILPLDEAATREVVQKLRARAVEGIAVCFLHACANPSHERRVREICRELYPEAQVAISSDITGEFREFERTSTVVLNTYVMPRMASYLGELEARLLNLNFRGALNVMQSTGGMMSSEMARNVPIRTLESGPAGGVIGAVALGKQIGHPNLIAADVGGTSFDVALIVEGRPFEKAETHVSKLPVLQPTIDIMSVGAGGGSIAWLDEEGSFRVGPQSAEADPGPACFGKGGTEPTVTDAHLVLGRINPDYFLGQRMKLHVEQAAQAIQKRIADPLGLSLQEAAYGITRLADSNMINAIRQVTIERGHDPRDFSLLCYGGGGGLFAGALAEELGIPHAIIPVDPAVFSAWGILNADFREDLVRTSVMPTGELSVDDLVKLFDKLAEASLERLQHSGVSRDGAHFVRLVDMRYQGQEHTVRVPVPSDSELRKSGIEALQHRFDKLHEQTYAHAFPGSPTEVVNLRLSAIRESRKPLVKKVNKGAGDVFPAIKAHRNVYFKETEGQVDCPVYDREKLGGGDRFNGPAIIEEWSSTIIVLPGQSLEVDAYGNLVINTIQADTGAGIVGRGIRTLVDPITTQVIRNSLVSAAEEMRLALVKTAHNTLIYEVQDFAVGLLTARGERLAEGTSLPLFLDCLPATILSGLKKFGPDGFRPGDIIIANDPYTTGTHISDTAIYLPVFWNGELQAFSINMAHWADVGGKTPGGWCPDSTDVHQEGMLFPHLKLYEEGRINQALMDYILANTRFPSLVKGDLGAQIAASRTGSKCYVALCDKYGADSVRWAMEAAFDQSEALVRRMISQMPDGQWSAESCLDHDGVLKNRRRKIKVTVRIEGDEMTIDFAGTDETASGPINIPLPAARAAAEIAFKSVTVPLEHSNAGHSRPLKVVSPLHTITNPSWPAPCDSYGYAALLITDLVSEALSHAVPTRCPAGEYMLFGANLYRGDPRFGKPFIYVDPACGGGGAQPFDDGADGLIFHGDGDAPNIPVEVAETRYPLFFERYQLHNEEYGIGKFRGGLGIIRDYRILTDHAYLQLANEQTVCRSHGLRGGHNGGISRLWLRPGTDQEEVLTERISPLGPFHSGDVISCRTAGGAGYGDPLERDPERVRWEVLNEILSPEKAKESYGVIIELDPGGDPVVNRKATEAYREQRRNALSRGAPAKV